MSKSKESEFVPVPSIEVLAASHPSLKDNEVLQRFCSTRDELIAMRISLKKSERLLDSIDNLTPALKAAYAEQHDMLNERELWALDEIKAELFKHLWCEGSENV